MRRSGLWTAVIVAIVTGVWAGSKSHRSEVQKTPVGEVSATTDSDPIPPEPGLIAPGGIPATLPPFTLSDAAGKPTSSESWKGRSLIINYWATWCAPCQREIPLLQSLQSEWLARGYTVVGIAVDFPDKVRAFATAHAIRYPLLVGEQDALDVAASLGVSSPAFPFTVFTDRRGRIVAVFLGELHKPQTDLILSAVESLNQAQSDLPAARARIANGLKALAVSGPG